MGGRGGARDVSGELEYLFEGGSGGGVLIFCDGGR